MSINNFIPRVWSARLLTNLRKNLIYAQPGVINRDYEGEITAQGSSVKINAIGSVSIGDYTKNQDFSSGAQVLDDASQMMIINRSRYFNFFLDDVDRVQQTPKLMDAAMGEAAYAMAKDIDTYVAGVMDASSQTALGTSGTPLVIGLGATDVNAYETLVDLSVAMDDNNIPPEGRWCAVPPWYYGYLLKDIRFTSFGTDANRTTLANGVIGGAAGMTILRSTNVPKVTTTFSILAGHGIGTTFAEQMNQTEAYRPQARFGDAVKGLALYDAKVIRPSAVVKLYATKGT